MTRPREAGFTLVEVMIALAIFAMIAVAGVAILSFSVRAGAATAARLDGAAALARTVSLLSSDLGQAVDRPTRDEGGIARPAFTGGAGAAETPLLALVRGGWDDLDGRAASRVAEGRVAAARRGGRADCLARARRRGAARPRRDDERGRRRAAALPAGGRVERPLGGPRRPAAATGGGGHPDPP